MSIFKKDKATMASKCTCTIKRGKLITICKLHSDWATKRAGEAYTLGAERALYQAAKVVEKIKPKSII